MGARLVSWVVWAAVAFSAAAWGLRWMARPEPVPPNAAITSQALPAGGDLTRMLSAPAKPADPVQAVVPVDARFKLIGVVAPRAAGHGVARTSGGLALIAVDGKPARAVAVGKAVEGDLVVLAVGHRRVDLGPRGGPASAVLELPPLPEPTRGVPPIAAPFGAVPPNAAPFGAAVPQPLVPPALPPQMRNAIPAPTFPRGMPPNLPSMQGLPGMQAAPQLPRQDSQGPSPTQ